MSLNTKKNEILTHINRFFSGQKNVKPLQNTDAKTRITQSNEKQNTQVIVNTTVSEVTISVDDGVT